jgi:hypothetical protein
VTVRQLLRFQLTPLDGHQSSIEASAAQYQYHIKVVPTLYEKLSGSVIDTEQVKNTAPEFNDDTLATLLTSPLTAVFSD